MAEDPEEEESTETRFRRVQEELRSMESPEISDDEIDERLDAIKSNGRASLPDVPFAENGLSELELRLKRAKGTHTKAKGDSPASRESDAKATRGLGVGLAIAYGFLGLSMAGLGIGFLIDRATGGTQWKGLGTVMGAVAGIAFAIFLSNRETPRL